jgi:hypothetical protein
MAFSTYRDSGPTDRSVPLADVGLLLPAVRQIRASLVSLAILADSDPRWRPHNYETKIAGCGLRFQFPVFKALDCEDAETRFEQTGNPFALVF